jgi:tetratricopeptide (TPR) repeat protein
MLGATADTTVRATTAFEDAVLRASRPDPAGDGQQQMDRARALAILGRNDEALVAANAAAATDPDNFGLPVGRGEVLDQIGRHADALASYRVGMARLEAWLKTASREEADRYQRMHALLLVRLNRLADALAIVAARSGRGARTTLLTLGCQTRAEANAELARALADCDAALVAEPQNDKALFARGLVSLRAERWADAERDFSALLVIQPENPDALYGRGLARQHLRRIADANADIAAARQQLFYIDSEFDRRGLRQPDEALSRLPAR